MQYLVAFLRIIIYLIFMSILMWGLIKNLLQGILKKTFLLLPFDYMEQGVVTSVFSIMAQVILWKISETFLIKNNPFRHNFKYVVVTILIFSIFSIFSFIFQYLHHIRALKLHKWNLIGLILDFLVILGVSLIVVWRLHLSILTMDQWPSLIDSILFIMIIVWLVVMDECILQRWVYKARTSK